MGTDTPQHRHDTSLSCEPGHCQPADAYAGPQPSPHFRRRAWRDFQRAIDPLAPPRPLPPLRHH